MARYCSEPFVPPRFRFRNTQRYHLKASHSFVDASFPRFPVNALRRFSQNGVLIKSLELEVQRRIESRSRRDRHNAEVETDKTGERPARNKCRANTRNTECGEPHSSELGGPFTRIEISIGGFTSVAERLYARFLTTRDFAAAAVPGEQNESYRSADPAGCLPFCIHRVFRDCLLVVLLVGFVVAWKMKRRVYSTCS
ncbi:hypothetical protein HN011_002765 [Eciton burchellii]|nr:hypothetical protein HN011_002765 [Eciton burchellii]